MKYYTSQEHFEKRYRNTYRTHEFRATTKEEFEVWSHSFREKLHELLGTTQMQQAPLYPEELESVPCDGYIRKKMLIHTEEDIIMPFYVLIPDDLKAGEKRSAVIACHGHGMSKEAVVGLRDRKPVADAIDTYNCNYGEVLAKKGYVVFAPDTRGFGERRERYFQGEEDKKLLYESCFYLNRMGYPLGQSVAGMWAWDLMRLVDYAQSCDFVNGHMACIGLSGGGLQTLFLSALDTRIECCVISGYFYGCLESLLVTSQCFCNYIPNLWRVADMGDIGALICPRPVLVETGDQDDASNGASGLNNVYPQVEKVRKAMKLFGVEDHLYHDVYQGGHKWHGKYAYDWILMHVPPVIES